MNFRIQSGVLRDPEKLPRPLDAVQVVVDSLDPTLEPATCVEQMQSHPDLQVLRGKHTVLFQAPEKTPQQLILALAEGLSFATGEMPNVAVYRSPFEGQAADYNVLKRQDTFPWDYTISAYAFTYVGPASLG